MIHALNLLSDRLDTPDLEEDEILSLKDAIKTLENIIKLRAITSELPARRNEIETFSKANLALEGSIHEWSQDIQGGVPKQLK